jgi:hypothetical protein
MLVTRFPVSQERNYAFHKERKVKIHTCGIDCNLTFFYAFYAVYAFYVVGKIIVFEYQLQFNLLLHFLRFLPFTQKGRSKYTLAMSIFILPP